MSDYVQQNLRPGETVVHRGRMSLVPALSGGCINLAFSLVVLLGAYAIASNHSVESWYNQAVGASATKRHPGALSQLPYSSVTKWLPLIAATIFIFAVVSLLRGWIVQRTAEYAVTDQRVIGKYGLISQQSVNVMLVAISGVSTSNTLFGRMFGYGTVLVEGPGICEQLVNIQDARAFEAAVYNSRESAGTSASALGVTAAPPWQTRTAPVVATDSRYCASCGRELDPGARFCVKCGNPVG
jgi:hypothetical protein